MGKNEHSSFTHSPGKEFVITRIVAAPRELVFKAFTEQERLKHWWGPKGFLWKTGTLDFRAGGSFHYCMCSPDGQEMWGKFVYREIVAPEKIVFVTSFSDAKGGIVRAPMSTSWPLEVLNTLTLSENNGKTTLTLRVGPINATEEERKMFESFFQSMEKGFGGTFDQLDEYLASTKIVKELTLKRIFNSPRALVFNAWTDPKQLAIWWGPKGFTNPVCEIDVKPGGAILIHMRAPDGVVYPMSGSFIDIVEPELLIFTSSALDKNNRPLFEVLTTVTFADHNGKTELTMNAKVTSATPEAEPYLNGMDEGWKLSLDRLQNHVENTSDREVIVTRLLNAPRELVFEVWTNPNHVAKWWGPNGFKNTIHEMDVTPGGYWRFIMHGPDGVDFKNEIRFLEVVKPERLVYFHGPSPKFYVTVTFESVNGKTNLTMKSIFESAAELERVVKVFNAIEGGKQHLTRLEEYLSKNKVEIL